MEQEFDKNRILSRVRKLMALANNAAATEGERDNALRMAHATLAKYNLTMAQAEMSGQQPSEKRTDGTFNLREYAWMRSVAVAVGELFFCSFFFTPYKPKHAVYCFIGKESNVYTAIEMAQYVIGSINREGTQRATAIGETARGTYWRDFCKGAMIRIVRRCRELAIAAAKETAEPIQGSTGTSLVLASVYDMERRANEKYIKEMVGELRTRKSRQKQVTTGGYQEGYEYGGTLSLNRQVSSKNQDNTRLPSK